MADALNPLGNVFNSGRNLAPAAVGSQVLLMSTLSAATVLLFNVLRPNNKVIYEPKVKYHVGNKSPPPISDSFFGWLPPLFRTREPELLDKVGLDAVAFLRFLRLMRWAFTGTAAFTCGVLIPINWFYNKEFPPVQSDVLSMMTIRDVKGNRLYFHVGITYVVTFLVLGLVYYHWTKMVELRKQWFRSPEYAQSFYARTVGITNVPKKYQSDDGIKTILANIGMPYPATSVHIGRKVGQLPELIEYHNATVRELEAVLVKYLKGGHIGKHRPTVRVGGFCGCGGERRDAIDFYTTKLKRTEAAVEAFRAQIDSRKAERFGFASLAAVPYAHIVASKLKGKRPKGTKITLAPNPKDILWKNMNMSDSELYQRKFLGYFWLLAVCFFSLIPLLPVAISANLDAITDTGYLPFLQEWSDNSPASYSIVSGVLPPALAGLFTFFLPRIMRMLTNYMGALTHSHLDKAVIARFFAFLVISQLVIFTLLGVVFNSVLEIVTEIGKHASAATILANLNKLPANINKTYINQASFWLKWFPFRGFLVVFDLAQIINLVWISFKTHVFGRTPRDIREWTQPPEFEYAIYYANILFMAAVGFLFAPLAPLVALAAAIVFWMSSWLYKYQLMFVFVTKVETGGRLWNVVINRLLFALLMMQALMVLTIGLQHKFHSLQWLSTVPPLLIVIIFKLVTKAKFSKEFDFYVPSEEELRHCHIHSQNADARGHRLQNRFGHPALHQDLFTPMLHAKMMPLLAEVYKGRISQDAANFRVKERGGRQLEAQVVEGIKIAYVEQKDLEYDPALYERDRGEPDWDTQSTTSTNLLGGGPRRDNTGSMWSRSNADPATFSYYGSGGSAAGSATNVTQFGMLAGQRQASYNDMGSYAQPGAQYGHPGLIAAHATGNSSRPQSSGGIGYEPRPDVTTYDYSDPNAAWNPSEIYAPSTYSASAYVQPQPQPQPQQTQYPPGSHQQYPSHASSQQQLQQQYQQQQYQQQHQMQHYPSQQFSHGQQTPRGSYYQQ